MNTSNHKTRKPKRSPQDILAAKAALAAKKQERLEKNELIESKIIRSVHDAGWVGVTSSEIEAATGLHANAINPRLTHMRDAGVIVTNEERRKTKAHPRGEYVYWTIGDIPSAPVLRETVGAKAYHLYRDKVAMILTDHTMSPEMKLYEIASLYSVPYF